MMGMLFVLFWALFWIGVIGGGFYLAVRFLRAFEQRGTLGSPRSDPLALSERVRRLEETIESMGAEIERLGEGQQFTHRLLTERQTPRGTPAVPPPDAAALPPTPPAEPAPTSPTTTPPHHTE